METELRFDAPLDFDVDGPTPQDCAAGTLEGVDQVEIHRLKRNNPKAIAQRATG